ncbi:site-specific integrase [Streptococcus suis]|uniref:Prophage LambdaSa03, site-specific recombinase phage integrase n=1 Tax=Streptococcus suis TaxID=1307 RepID=A0A0Z8CH13_STRSU|nr:site-specific integrase [Streptococcus suis]QBX21388.1 integrase [Streptococcus phage Javan573]NQH67517.1 site-specific integrase [Streptococcus suis]NQI05524.1 site-specific integrase [Streptococcus suis]CYU02931.1 prophage LambdaSa03%2C site-specific recombinase phage integrase [Streptococcus suis]CYU25177.1 prophage LambdaSa03%2C site-specific recombinase phage integrase [Streptococcus suis]
MWPEAHESGKVNFVERYRDPYTQKWKRKSVLMEKDTPRIRKEAQKILDAKIADILSKLKSSEMLFTDLFDQWWTFYQQEIKRTSIASLKGNIKEIRESFGIDVKVVNIDPKYVQTYLDSLDCSRNKKERNKSMLNLAFDYAVDLDIIKDNPARRAKLPRIKKTLGDWKKIEEKYLEEDEIKPLLKELFRRPSTYRTALLAEFMSLNGCRIGEAVSLEPENRDFETNILQLHGTYDHTEGYRNGEKTTPKTNASYRETFMTKREMEIIEELEFMNELEKNTNPRYRDMGYIFTTKNGVPIQTNSFNLALKKANQRLEKPIQKNLTSHIFRHTLVSRLAENRVPLKAIMDRVGHADAKTTTQIYTHVTKKLKANVAEIMEKY